MRAPRRGALVVALVVAVVLLVGSVGATVAWAHAEARIPFGIARPDGSSTEHGRPHWRVPPVPQRPAAPHSPRLPHHPAPAPSHTTAG